MFLVNQLVVDDKTRKQMTKSELNARVTYSRFLEMTNKPTKQFWTLLTMVNLLALIYPIHLELRANSVEENLFATFVFLGFLFLLVVVDAASIVVAEAVGAGKR
jgi:hypothetical protein